MNAQLDMFGGAAEPKKAPPKPAKKKPEDPTCWEDCLLCGKEWSSHRGRVFKFCTYPGRLATRCYEDTLICDLASRPLQPKPDKSASYGWSDY